MLILLELGIDSATKSLHVDISLTVLVIKSHLNPLYITSGYCDDLQSTQSNRKEKTCKDLRGLAKSYVHGQNKREFFPLFNFLEYVERRYKPPYKGKIPTLVTTGNP